jgi:hypothetical protein
MPTMVGKKRNHQKDSSVKQLLEIAWDMWRHQMEILATPDSQSLLAQMTALDEQVRFTRLHDTPIQAMQ